MIVNTYDGSQAQRIDCIKSKGKIYGKNKQ